MGRVAEALKTSCGRAPRNEARQFVRHRHSICAGEKQSRVPHPFAGIAKGAWLPSQLHPRFDPTRLLD
jgi:hypothetical protein